MCLNKRCVVFNKNFVKMVVFYKLGTFTFWPCVLKSILVLDFRTEKGNEWKNVVYNITILTKFPILIVSPILQYGCQASVHVFQYVVCRSSSLILSYGCQPLIHACVSRCGEVCLVSFCKCRSPIMPSPVFEASKSLPHWIVRQGLPWNWYITILFFLNPKPLLY